MTVYSEYHAYSSIQYYLVQPVSSYTGDSFTAPFPPSPDQGYIEYAQYQYPPNPHPLSPSPPTEWNPNCEEFYPSQEKLDYGVWVDSNPSNFHPCTSYPQDTEFNSYDEDAYVSEENHCDDWYDTNPSDCHLFSPSPSPTPTPTPTPSGFNPYSEILVPQQYARSGVACSLTQKPPRDEYEYLDLNKMTIKNQGSMTNIEYQEKMNDLRGPEGPDQHEYRPWITYEMVKLNQLRNDFLDEDVLDLHYLTVDMAKPVLEDRIARIKDGQLPSVLYCVTGRGNHSFGRVSKLKNYVIEYARACGYECREQPKNKGVLILTVN